MLYVCDNCQLIYPRRLPNCPKCGGRLFEDHTTLEVLQENGYRQSDLMHKKEAGHKSGSQSSSTLEKLRNGYRSEQHSADSVPALDFFESSNKHGDDSSDTHEHRRHNDTQRTHTHDDDDDFFSSNRSSDTREELPRIHAGYPYSTVNSTETHPEHSLRHSSPNPNLEGRIRRSAFLESISNFFSRIRPATLFRILAVVLVIVTIWTIWVNRYAILSSITNLIISLIPLIIVIYLFVKAFKSLFK